MSTIVVTGAGMNGVATAILLARDGHEVTVLERIRRRRPLPARPGSGGSGGGSSQLRQLHYLHQRWRHLAEAELPGLVPALEGAGAIRFNPSTSSVPPSPASVDPATSASTSSPPAGR